MSNLHFLTEGEFERALVRLEQKRQKRTGRGTRRHSRRALNQDFVLRDEDGLGFMRLRSIDISPTGVLLSAPDVYVEDRDGFWLEFKAPRSGRHVKVWGRLARTEDGDTKRPGIAFEFLDLSEQDWEEICDYIARAAA